MKKSVAIIGTRGYPSYYGGFETAVRKLAPYLSDLGWQVTVYGRPGTTKDDDLLLDPRINRVVTAGLESKSLSTLTYGLTSVIHALFNKPDVALIMNVANGFWLPLLRARGIPTLVNVDGIEWERAKWSWIAKFVFRLGARLTAIFANEIVVDSREISQRWEAQFKRQGIFIPYGGDVPEPLAIEPGLTHRGYILVVARFVPENTIPEFLDAAVNLSTKWPIVIVGSSGYGGEIEDQILNLVANTSSVKWLGHIADDRRLLSLWQHAGAYFHGHSVGGTNPALVQAMACGSPVVARDTIYNREVLGESAIFVEPTSSSIEAGISKCMLETTASTMRIIAALKIVTENYSWEMISEEYEVSLTLLAKPQGSSNPASVESS